MNRREFLKSAGVIALLGIGGSALSNCAQVPSELRAITTQLLWILNSEFIGFYAADIKGYYADEGLDVGILSGGVGIPTLDLVETGRSEIGVHGSSTSFLSQVEQGVSLKAFAACFQRSPAGLMSIITYPDGTPGDPIYTPQDAVGKRIGLQDGAIPGWTIITRKAGLDPETDMEMIPVSWDPTPLFDGTVDGYWCYATNQPGIARLEGYEIAVLDVSEWGNRAYGNFCIAKEETLQNDTDMVVGWLRATLKGWEYANNNIEEMVRHTIDVVSPDLGLIYEQQMAEAIDQIDYMKSPLTEEKGLFWMEPSVWEGAMENLVELDELDEMLPMDKVMTTEILEEVYG